MKKTSNEEDFVNRSSTNSDVPIQNFLSYIHSNIIGHDFTFRSPYGLRKTVYCDYTASGRSLKFVEDYITDHVLPSYGSTHTAISVTSLQTSLYRSEARDIIRNSVRASEHDRVIFTGSGATSAMQKLVHGLKTVGKRLVALVDFYSHHSSLLPWKEAGAIVIRIKENSTGTVDLKHLKEILQQYSNPTLIPNYLVIGCFTYASNITGIVADDVKITSILHEHGALAFWDYATAAPYVDIQMNPIIIGDSKGLAYKDAIFFSLHKFLGGVQTPGVLIAKQSIFQNNIPSETGGGTIFFVSREGHRFLKDVEEREEGGTPPIVETIRAGMIMQLKMAISPEAILKRCRGLSEKINFLVQDVPEIAPLGNIDLDNKNYPIDHLPILSFLVLHKESNLFLHPYFVSAVLNDLYGIQSRSGCACAGPYALDLLGIDDKLAERYESILLETDSLDRDHLRRREEYSSYEMLRPGFTRINIPYTASDKEVMFILEAIRDVSKFAWKLLPQYQLQPETGEWKHISNLVFKGRNWLQYISYSKGYFESNLKPVAEGDVPNFDKCLAEAKRIYLDATKAAQRVTVSEENQIFNESGDSLRYFLLPSEVKNILLGKPVRQAVLPFNPLKYPLTDEILSKRPEYKYLGPPMQNCLSCKKCSIPLTQVEDKGNARNSDCSKFDDHDATDVCGKLAKCQIKEGGSEECMELTNCAPLLNGDLVCATHDFSSSSTKRTFCKDNTQYKEENCKFDSKAKREVIKPVGVSDNSGNKVKIVKRISLWKVPPKVIFGPTVEALEKFSMILDKDRVLVCLSGGKDSLSLLHTLLQVKYYLKSKGINFSIGAATVDPKSSAYDPSPLIPYIDSLGIPYFYEVQDILLQAQSMTELNSICSFCSRLKRGRLYACARKNNYNVLAFGQHLDDMAESFMMSCMHNGRLRSMKASYSVKEGDLRIIRPFAFVREKDLRVFAESQKLPIIPENCPGCFEAPKERHRVKQLLAQQEILFPRLFWSLKTAMLPLVSIDRTGVENALFGKNSTFISRNTESDDD